MGFPRALEFLLLGLELGYPALDLGALGRHRDKPSGSYGSNFCRPWQFSRHGLCGRFGGLGPHWASCCGSRRLGRGDPLYKRQRLFDQLVALTHPQFHHAYPRARKHFTGSWREDQRNCAGTDRIGAARDRLATARNAALNDSSSPRDARLSASLMKTGRFLGNALRHCDIFNHCIYSTPRCCNWVAKGFIKLTQFFIWSALCHRPI
jgi:hypothetical protein